jgi:hypothetical protein
MKVLVCRLVMTAFAGCMAASVALPQQAKPFPSYKTQEEYCAANPKMPTCIKLNWDPKKLNVSGMTDEQLESIRRLSGTSKSGPVRRTVTTASAASAKVDVIPVALAAGKTDWRFAHPNAAALISLNIRAILSSPALESLFSQFTGQLTAQFPGLNPSDLSKTRALLSSVDRICVSVQSGGATPETVALITGHFDERPL